MDLRGTVFSQVGEHAGSRPKRFTLSSLAAGVVIVIDWVCCSRHFVFFQLSIGCPLIFFFFFFFTSALVQIPTDIACGAGVCTALCWPALCGWGEPAPGLHTVGSVQGSV